MIKPFDKIVIVGGGSAGWMTAAALIKAFPEKNITVIESPNVPILGVGESTLGGINDYCRFLGIDEKDFMTYTDASYKMSIKFTDFYEKDAGGFHYPFGRPFVEGTQNGMNDWLVKKALYPDTPIEDFVHCFFPAAPLWDQNKFSLNKYGQFDNYNPDNDVAYHFDATKFGRWLCERYCKPRGVVHIADTVEDIATDENGIKSLTLASKEVVTADLYIDCTGFKSLLLGGALKEPFISYSDMLPNNRAWATRMPYKDKEREMEPFTNSTALGNGWSWNIPSWERLGTGYVYSDKFISPEDAKEEFKQYLMSDKMICPRTREEVDAMEYKDIPMRVGIHERTFVKNVVAIGLSAGFIEPLESNGLFSVHEFLFKLIKTMLRPAISQWDRDVYNASTFGMWRNFAQFVALHYALSIRTDTPYWQANANRVYSPGLPTLQPDTAIGFNNLQADKMFNNTTPEIGGITWISVGCNYFIIDKVAVEQRQSAAGKDFKKEYDPIFRMFEHNKDRWRKAAEDKPSLYQYLKDNIHKEDSKGKL
jgi:tryptophan halogenase